MQILIQEVWNGARDFVFPTSSPVMLIQLRVARVIIDLGHITSGFPHDPVQVIPLMFQFSH